MERLPHSGDPAASLYQGEAGLQYHEGKRGLRPECLEWVMAARAKKFQPHVRAEDVVVEFGVGSGWNLGRLRCQRRIGIDAADFLADRAKALGIEFFTDITAVGDAVADVVICHHTLEHVLEPAKVLRQFASVLKSGGRLILHVPWERESRYSRHLADEPNHHLYTWNVQNLGNLVKVLGFKIQTAGVRQYGYDRFAAELAARMRLGAAGFNGIRAALILLRPLYEVELICHRP